LNWDGHDSYAGRSKNQNIEGVRIKIIALDQHAEMVAISSAQKKLRSTSLDECTVYSTIEPIVGVRSEKIAVLELKTKPLVTNEHVTSVAYPDDRRRNCDEALRFVRKHCGGAADFEPI
jgi:hypothetical protein